MRRALSPRRPRSRLIRPCSSQDRVRRSLERRRGGARCEGGSTSFPMRVGSGLAWVGEGDRVGAEERGQFKVKKRANADRKGGRRDLHTFSKAPTPPPVLLSSTSPPPKRSSCCTPHSSIFQSSRTGHRTETTSSNSPGAGVSPSQGTGPLPHSRTSGSERWVLSSLEERRDARWIR